MPGPGAEEELAVSPRWSALERMRVLGEPGRRRCCPARPDREPSPRTWCATAGAVRQRVGRRTGCDELGFLGRPDVDGGVDNELDRRGGNAHQSVGEPSGSEGPGRSRADAEQGGRRVPPPAFSAGNREIHAVAHPCPPSAVQPMAHCPVRDPSRKALLPGDEPTLLVDDLSQRGEVRRCRRTTKYGTERSEIRHRASVVKPARRDRCSPSGAAQKGRDALIVGTT